MKKIITSVFFHEIKNSLNSIRFGIEVFDKYEMTTEEKKNSIKDILSTIDNTSSILDEYMQFVKFQFSQKLEYENVNIYSLLLEIQKELTPFAKEKSINIYIKKDNFEIYTNKFWLKRAIYNIIYNAIKYNKEYGAVNIRMEDSSFGIYLSISDTGVGIKHKQLKKIFKLFKKIDETQKGVGIGLALAKSVIDSLGGDIHVESNENIGSEFVLYIPYNPKSVTIKRIMLSMIPASIILFLGISYFPIYPQSMEKNINGGYITYKLEDGSILSVTQNSDYELKAYKNLYNTKYILNSSIKNGDMSLKAIKNKASIYVDDREFNNLGTDFEIIKDKFIKLAVFDGKVKNDALMLDKGQGGLFKNKIKIVKLLPEVKFAKIQNGYLSFKPSPKSLKYKIIISTHKDFSQIENSLFSVKANINLHFSKDTLYYIKIYQYDENGLPSLPKVIKYINLSHYEKAIHSSNMNETILELETSIVTIQNYSSLPYFKLAQILYKENKYFDSLKLIKKAIGIKEKKEYYYLLFDIYHKLNKENEIEKILVDVLKKYPEDIKFLFYKAKMLYKNQNYKQANQVLFKILQQKPNYKQANKLMYEVLEKLGNKEKAKFYERLVK